MIPTGVKLEQIKIHHHTQESDTKICVDISGPTDRGEYLQSNISFPDCHVCDKRNGRVGVWRLRSIKRDGIQIKLGL